MQQCRSVAVHIATTPELRLDPPSATVYRGQSLRIRCLSSDSDQGYGTLGYSWTRNNALFQSDVAAELWEDLYPDGSILKICNIQVIYSITRYLAVTYAWLLPCMWTIKRRNHSTHTRSPVYVCTHLCDGIFARIKNNLNEKTISAKISANAICKGGYSLAEKNVAFDIWYRHASRKCRTNEKFWFRSKKKKFGHFCSTRNIEISKIFPGSNVYL